jgi:hypothetical protein
MICKLARNVLGKKAEKGVFGLRRRENGGGFDRPTAQAALAMVGMQPGEGGGVVDEVGAVVFYTATFPQPR